MPGLRADGACTSPGDWCGPLWVPAAQGGAVGQANQGDAPVTDYCGRPTRAGHPCRIALKAGRCATHDADLKKRNRKVRRAFAHNDPAGFAAHQRQAAKAGFAATAHNHDWAKAHEKARQWRIKHPSQPEQWALGVLASRGLSHFEREWQFGDDGRYTLDLAWPEYKLGVEVDGHPRDWNPALLSDRRRRQARKIASLESQGWTVLTIDAAGDRETEATRLIAFAEKAQN